MRPDLNKETKIEDFKSYYWLKKELQLFCRQLGASTSGSKEELLKRVGIYLETGKVVKPIRQASKKSKKSNNNLNVETVIGEDHRCGQDVRAFFKSMIPQFHFSTFIQQYFKNNSEKTYQDVINAWYEEENRKKDPAYKRKIGPQFEYNQFIRDFFTDPYNQGKKREDAIKAWNEMKSQPGSNKYIPMSK